MNNVEKRIGENFASWRTEKKKEEGGGLLLFLPLTHWPSHPLLSQALSTKGNNKRETKRH